MVEQQRLLSLVPVGLREAVIDSPPFRASIRHFEDQVDALEKWLEGYIKVLSDWLSALNRLEEYNTILAARGAPSFLAEGLIDPDYTFLAMTRFAEGKKQFWGKICAQGKEVKEIMVVPLTKFLREDIKEFKHQRREFNKIQDKYEDLVSRYASQSKTKEPSSLREDAYQLYSVRMGYVQASASYSIAISSFRTACDRVLVSAFAGFALRGIRLQTELSKNFGGIYREMNKILAWSDEMNVSAKSLHDQLSSAKAKLEKEVSDAVQPRRDLSIYQTYTLPSNGKVGSGSRVPRSSVGSDPSARKPNYSVSSSGKPAKQGWLFQRITTGKPARNTWVRRWFFVKDGTFGWLHNNPKTAAVEESERVGVLLCNVRLAPTEERRFCFEVMTKSVNYMLQAETETDLGDWVEVFEVAQNAVLADEGQHPQAFAIMPPTYPEFAAPQTEEHDRHGQGSGPNLATPQSVTPRASFDVTVTPPVGGGGSMQASRSIVQKLESRLKDRPKIQPPTPAGGIASLVAASQSIAGQHVPMQQLQISAPRPIDVFVDPVGGSNIAPGTLATPPVSTQMSTRAVQARIRSASNVSGNIPSGAMGNYWGSMNWGLVSLRDGQSGGGDSTNQAQGSADTTFEKSQRRPSLVPLTPSTPNPEKGESRPSLNGKRNHAQSLSSADYSPIIYPPDYPVELKKQDAQFRTLFPTASPDEFVLLVCRVMWQPIEGQQLWGRMYATNSGLNFFAHAQGMVCVQTVPFSDIVRISHHIGLSADHIVIERENIDPIECKVYLDSANLITRRVDMLFRNSLSDTPMDTAEVLQEIRQMEEEKETDLDENVSGRVEEAFEVHRPPTSTESLLADETTRQGLPPQLLRRSGDTVRVVFPSEPVTCDCKDHLEKEFTEQIFSVPAKSLFHVMFGDSTPIWKKVYRGRRISDVEIGPWKSANKELIREYKYTIDYADAIMGRRYKKQIVEYQKIIKRDEFLCYVVIAKMIPIDLPRSDCITMLHKYCISYVSKSKCKLRVSTGLNLAQVPRVIRAFVKKAANRALEDTARRVVSEVQNQVNVLGRGTDIQRAIQMYGRIGATADLVVTKTGFVGDPEHPLQERTMASLFMEDMIGTTEGIVEDVFYLPSTVIHRIFGFVTAHKILIIIVMFSILANVFLSARSTVTYWHQRSAERMMQKIGVKPNNAMVRMVSLKEIDDLVKTGLQGANATDMSLCYNKFTEIYGVNDLADSTYDAGTQYIVPAAREKASQLRESRQRLNVLRHELLVSLRSVNLVERELVQGEWMTWLGEELYRCDLATRLVADAPDEELKARTEDIIKIKDYCEDCQLVWANLKEGFTALT